MITGTMLEFEPPLALLSLPIARPPADAVVCVDCAWLPPDRYILLRNPPFFFGWSASLASFLSLLSSSFLSADDEEVEDEDDPPVSPFAPASTVRISATGFASQVMCSV